MVDKKEEVVEESVEDKLFNTPFNKNLSIIFMSIYLQKSCSQFNRLVS